MTLAKDAVSDIDSINYDLKNGKSEIYIFEKLSGLIQVHSDAKKLRTTYTGSKRFQKTNNNKEKNLSKKAPQPKKKQKTKKKKKQKNWVVLQKEIT